MNRLLEDLVKVLTLERLELNMFRGESRDIGSPQVFGGQVLGQALVAATATVENRAVHSLHAYFLRRGDCKRLGRRRDRRLNELLTQALIDLSGNGLRLDPFRDLRRELYQSLIELRLIDGNGLMDFPKSLQEIR